MAGLTATGFEAKTLETILEEIRVDLRARVSPNIDLGTESPNGQLVGVFAGRERALWELLEAVHNSQYPASASGRSLTNVATITGTTREAATPSVVLVTVNVDPGTYAAGTLVAHVDGNPAARFSNAEEVTNGGGAAANVTGVSFTSEDTGPVRANSGTLTVIAGAVAGWNSVTNPLDAELGSDEEADSRLRLRREAELARRGSTTVDAVRVDLLDVEGVESVNVLENDTDVTDGDGLPPHSLEAIVLGGTDEDITAAIFNGKAGGIRAYGAVTETHVDSQGVSHAVGHTRPTELEVWVGVEILDSDPLTYVGTTAVQEALADWGAINLGVGVDVVRSRLLAIVMGLGGVEDAEVLLGFSDPPVTAGNLAVTARQIAKLDTSRILVS